MHWQEARCFAYCIDSASQLQISFALPSSRLVSRDRVQYGTAAAAAAAVVLPPPLPQQKCAVVRGFDPSGPIAEADD